MTFISIALGWGLGIGVGMALMGFARATQLDASSLKLFNYLKNHT